MSEIHELMRKKVAQLAPEPAPASSGTSRLSHETIQQPDTNGSLGPKFVIFTEEEAPLTPVAEVARTSGPVDTNSYAYPSNEPYRMRIEEPIHPGRQVFVPAASTSAARPRSRNVSRQSSVEPSKKIAKQPENHRRYSDCYHSDTVTPVSSPSGGYSSDASVSRQNSTGPYVKIIEQPSSMKRFRYDSDIESRGVIHGENSTSFQESFPKILIGNHAGPVEVTASLVCKDYPYRVHPNGIVGKQKMPQGGYSYIYVKQVQVQGETVIEFDDLGIRMVTHKQIKEALQLRKSQGIDPFGQGFSHTFYPRSNNLSEVRLCFQVKLANGQMLDPVVSNVISDSKKLGCLQILRMCTCTGSNEGGPNIILISKKLNPKDLQVIFFEFENNNLVWHDCVKKMEVYGNTTIVCEVPPYTRRAIEYDTPVEVSVVLRRPSDGECGDPRPFTYKTNDNTKKQKMIDDIVKQFVKEKWTPPQKLPLDYHSLYDQDWQIAPRSFDDKPVVAGSSDVNIGMPGPSHLNVAMPGSSHVNVGVPGSSHVNIGVPMSSHVNVSVPGLSHRNMGVPWPSHVNVSIPGPNNVDVSVPEPSYNNTFSPASSEWEHTQTNIPMSPDIEYINLPSIPQPMSVSEDQYHDISSIVTNLPKI